MNGSLFDSKDNEAFLKCFLILLQALRIFVNSILQKCLGHQMPVIILKYTYFKAKNCIHFFYYDLHIAGSLVHNRSFGSLGTCKKTQKAKTQESD